MRNIIALLSFCSLGAFAPTTYADENGFYLGGGAGAYFLDIDDTGFDDGAATAKVFAGYRLHPNLAIEADYQKLYESDGDIFGIDTDVKADAWTVALRPIVPLTDFIDLYGKIGYTWYDVEASASLGDLSFTGSGSERDLAWGAGVDFNFGNLSLRGELSRLEVDDADLNLLTAGVIYRF